MHTFPENHLFSWNQQITKKNTICLTPQKKQKNSIKRPSHPIVYIYLKWINTHLIIMQSYNLIYTNFLYIFIITLHQINYLL